MENHKVCVIECPNCGTEKTIMRIDVRCVVTYNCKVCKNHCRARRNQECFEFEGIVAVNAV